MKKAPLLEQTLFFLKINIWCFLVLSPHSKILKVDLFLCVQKQKIKTLIIKSDTELSVKKIKTNNMS